MKTLVKAVCVVCAASLIFISPGLGCWQAAAQAFEGGAADGAEAEAPINAISVSEQSLDLTGQAGAAFTTSQALEDFTKTENLGEEAASGFAAAPLNKAAVSETAVSPENQAPAQKTLQKLPFSVRNINGGVQEETAVSPENQAPAQKTLQQLPFSIRNIKYGVVNQVSKILQLKNNARAAWDEFFNGASLLAPLQPAYAFSDNGRSDSTQNSVPSISRSVAGASLRPSLPTSAEERDVVGQWTAIGTNPAWPGFTYDVILKIKKNHTARIWATPSGAGPQDLAAIYSEHGSWNWRQGRLTLEFLGLSATAPSSKPAVLSLDFSKIPQAELQKRFGIGVAHPLIPARVELDGGSHENELTLALSAAFWTSDATTPSGPDNTVGAWTTVIPYNPHNASRYNASLVAESLGAYKKSLAGINAFVSLGVFATAAITLSNFLNPIGAGLIATALAATTHYLIRVKLKKAVNAALHALFIASVSFFAAALATAFILPVIAAYRNWGVRGALATISLYASAALLGSWGYLRGKLSAAAKPAKAQIQAFTAEQNDAQHPLGDADLLIASVLAPNSRYPYYAEDKTLAAEVGLSADSWMTLDDKTYMAFRTSGVEQTAQWAQRFKTASSRDIYVSQNVLNSMATGAAAPAVPQNGYANIDYLLSTALALGAVSAFVFLPHVAIAAGLKVAVGGIAGALIGGITGIAYGGYKMSRAKGLATIGAGLNTLGYIAIGAVIGAIAGSVLMSSLAAHAAHAAAAAAGLLPLGLVSAKSAAPLANTLAEPSVSALKLMAVQESNGAIRLRYDGFNGNDSVFVSYYSRARTLRWNINSPVGAHSFSARGLADLSLSLESAKAGLETRINNLGADISNPSDRALLRQGYESELELIDAVHAAAAKPAVVPQNGFANMDLLLPLAVVAASSILAATGINALWCVIPGILGGAYLSTHMPWYLFLLLPLLGYAGVLKGSYWVDGMQNPLLKSLLSNVLLSGVCYSLIGVGLGEIIGKSGHFLAHLISLLK